MQLEFIGLHCFLPRRPFILVPTQCDLKGLPPRRVPEHIVLLPVAIFTVFWHNSPPTTYLEVSGKPLCAPKHPRIMKYANTYGFIFILN